METFDTNAVGNYVRTLIVNAGEGVQTALARHVGIAVPSVNRWANHKGDPAQRHWPKIEDYFKLPSRHATQRRTRRTDRINREQPGCAYRGCGDSDRRSNHEARANYYLQPHREAAR